MVTASSRRRRTSSPSCRCASGFSVSLEIEIASSSPPTTSPLPLSWVLPPSAATALILLTRLLLGTPLALYCNCSLTYNYQVSDFKHGHASSVSMALRFPSAYHRDFPFVTWSAKCCFPGTRLICTPPHVVTSCSRKYFNSVRLSLSKSSSRSNRFGCVGVRPHTNPRTQFQVCHHRLHSETFSRLRHASVVFGFSRAQRT